jgi:hypothetical protein
VTASPEVSGLQILTNFNLNFQVNSTFRVNSSLQNYKEQLDTENLKFFALKCPFIGENEVGAIT